MSRRGVPGLGRTPLTLLPGGFLEKTGFELVAVRPVATEPSDQPMAIYRLPDRMPVAEARHQPGSPAAQDAQRQPAPILG